MRRPQSTAMGCSLAALARGQRARRSTTSSSLATGEVFSLHPLVVFNMALEGCHETPGITVAMPRCNDLSLVIEEHKSGQTAARYVLFELLLPQFVPAAAHRGQIE